MFKSGIILPREDVLLTCISVKKKAQNPMSGVTDCRVGALTGRAITTATPHHCYT